MARRLNYAAARFRSRDRQARLVLARERTNVEAAGLARTEGREVRDVLAELLGESVTSGLTDARPKLARDGFGNVVPRSARLARYHRMTLQWLGLDGTNVAVGQVCAESHEALMARVATVGRALGQRLAGYGLDVVNAPSGFVVSDCERPLGIVRGYLVAPA